MPEVARTGPEQVLGGVGGDVGGDVHRATFETVPAGGQGGQQLRSAARADVPVQRSWSTPQQAKVATGRGTTGRGRRLVVRRGARQVVVVGPPWLEPVVRTVRSGDDVRVLAPCDVTVDDLPTGRRWALTVVDLATLAELQALGSPLLAHAPVVALTEDGDPSPADLLPAPIGPAGAAYKRALDVVVALVVLVLSLPVLLVAAVAITLDSRGPVLFTQTRVGVGGLPFRCLKLRTMHVRNDDTEHRDYCRALAQGKVLPQAGLYKLVTDPRITRVGRTLRRLSIDELPQLWNVLRGDMSVVGPRPCLPTDVEGCTARYWARLRVRPGLTGPWQVGGRARLSFEEMVRLDIEYWRGWTPLTDLRVLLRTPRAVLRTGTTA